MHCIAMPIYHFEIIRNGHGLAPSEGIDLPDIDAAWEEATTAFGQLIRDLDGSLKMGTDWSIEIQDDNRKPLRYISLASGVSLRSKSQA
ncbi:MAG: hypothetical protein Q7T55_25100 [Solirubrobacteraceae bacterium]|nr:hypothetical protein [Solirubrobacteraceae bacterium]